MWVGDTVYFLSDRSGPVTLFAYDTRARAVRQVDRQRGRLRHPVRLARARARSCSIISVRCELLRLRHRTDAPRGRAASARTCPQLRPRFEKVEGPQILHAALSPTGKRVLIEARGEILAVPAEKGDVRNLTRTPAVADRDPAWSPDGKWIAWFSDESGEYALHLRAPDGLGPVRKIDLGPAAVVLLLARAGRPTARRSRTPTSG